MTAREQKLANTLAFLNDCFGSNWPVQTRNMVGDALRCASDETSDYKRGLRAGLEAVRDRVDELLRECG